MTPNGTFPNIHVECSGPENAPAVLLLHGWGSSARLMQPLADALSRDFRVLNVDLPGHGLSPDPPAPWGVPEHAALVDHVVRQHLRPPVSVIGHSNGGRIALFMASTNEYRDLFERLILISPSGVRPKRGFRYRLKTTLARLLKAPFQVLPGPLREAGLDWLRHSLVWRLLGSSDYRALKGVMRETFVRTVNHFVEDRLEQIRVPTLLFWGEQDTAIGRRQMEVLERHIADAGLVVLPGAGHYGHLDDPTTVIAATRHFLTHTSEVAPAQHPADPA